MNSTPCISALAVALLALLAPAAAATAAQNTTTIEDASLDAFPPAANAWGDITRATMEQVGDATLRLGLDLAALPPVQEPGAAYAYTFRWNGTWWFGGYVMVPFPTFLVGEWDEAGNYPMNMDEADGT